VPLRAADVLQVNELDRRIWQQELEEFVPPQLYDMHSHLSRREFDLDHRARDSARTGKREPSSVLNDEGSLELLDEAEALLYPGRKVDRLLMGFPHQKCDFDNANTFIAREARKKPGIRALMMVCPGMTAQHVQESVVRHRFIGFKPYLWYSPISDVWAARITDFMPEHQLAVANRFGLIIGLHVSKRQAMADSQNLDDLERLTEKFPRVRWILYHGARSYSSWGIETAAPRLRHLQNIWLESSTICESDAFDAMFSNIDISRLCYGSDDFNAGVARGKYITWGYGWEGMNRQNQTFKTDHCDGRMTFVRYEMLRAMRRAARNHHLTRDQIEDVFFNNAARLVEDVWNDLTGGLETKPEEN
jgi:glutamate-1-semialdehyde 2,1-aminomutase